MEVKMEKAFPWILYLAIGLLWTRQIAKESKNFGMEPVFWSVTAFLLPLYMGVFLFYKTKKEVVKNHPEKKEGTELKKPIFLTIILGLLFLFSMIYLLLRSW